MAKKVPKLYLQKYGLRLSKNKLLGFTGGPKWFGRLPVYMSRFHQNFLFLAKMFFKVTSLALFFFSLLKNTCRQVSRYIRAPVRRLCRSSVISLQKGCLGAGHAPPSKRTKGPKRCKISVRKSSTKQAIIDHTFSNKI